jgi:hypothetical protein
MRVIKSKRKALAKCWQIIDQAQQIAKVPDEIDHPQRLIDLLDFCLGIREGKDYTLHTEEIEDSTNQIVNFLHLVVTEDLNLIEERSTKRVRE